MGLVEQQKTKQIKPYREVDKEGYGHGQQHSSLYFAREQEHTEIDTEMGYKPNEKEFKAQIVLSVRDLLYPKFAPDASNYKRE